MDKDKIENNFKFNLIRWCGLPNAVLAEVLIFFSLVELFVSFSILDKSGSILYLDSNTYRISSEIEDYSFNSEYRYRAQKNSSPSAIRLSAENIQKLYLFFFKLAEVWLKDGRGMDDQEERKNEKQEI